MSNGVAKQNEFDATTRVMESGLLRALANESSSADAKHAARATATSEPEVVAAQPDVAPELPARASRVFVVAGIVTAVVLAFDASLFVVHKHRALRPAAAAAAPPPMPAAAIAPPAVAPTPAPTPVVASAISDAAPSAAHAHRHSHHRHSSH